MTTRALAQNLARSAFESAFDGLFGFVRDRVAWRRDNAHRLMLEAHFMAELLADDPEFVPFRQARIRTWERRKRRHEARARAIDQLSTEACLLAAAGRM